MKWTVASALMLVACGYQMPTLAIAPAALVMPNGTKQQFIATLISPDGTQRDVTSEVTWSSSSPAVAVGLDGLVTATAVSEANITAALGTTRARASVTVRSAFDAAMVSLTFDDGKASQLQAAAALSDYGFHGTFYIVTAWAKEALAGCMNGNDLRQLAAAGHEVASHTVYHPHLSVMPDDRLALELSMSQQWLQRNVTQTAGQSFAAPFGEVDWRVLATGWKLYGSHRTTLPHHNYPDTNRFELGDYGAPTIVTADQLIDTAVAERSWLIMSFHAIAATPGAAGYPLDDLKAILRSLKTRGVRVVTVEEGITKMNAPTAPPSIREITPLSGSDVGGTTVTVMGNGFADGAKVRFGTAVADVVSVTPTRLVATSPAHDAGTIDVAVANPDGQAVIQSSGFQFTTAP